MISLSSSQLVMIVSKFTQLKAQVKHLGIIIDNRINFYEHIKVLECKIARSVGILTKLKTILSKQNLLQLYYTLVHSHLT